MGRDAEDALAAELESRKAARDAADATIYEVEFDRGGRIKIPNDSDSAVEAVAKRLGLWKGDPQRFPSFTLYRDGQEIGGG
jgi:hypothetical protein